MTDVERSLHLVFRDARRRRNMTQSELAHRVGCRQSALSMFERGRRGVLSREKVELAATELGVDLAGLTEGGAFPGVGHPSILKYCPVAECPSNVPYEVGGELYFRPAMVEASPAEKTRCGFCGEILEDRCPSEACGALLREGACCWRCGERLVAVDDADPAPVGWAECQRQAIRDVLGLSRVNRVRGVQVADESVSGD